MKKITLLPIGIALFLAIQILFSLIWKEKIIWTENILWVSLIIGLILAIALDKPKIAIILEVVSVFALLSILFINKVTFLLGIEDLKYIVNPLSYFIITVTIMGVILNKMLKKQISHVTIIWNNILILVVTMLIAIIILNNYEIIDMGLLYVKPWKLFLILIVNIIMCVELNKEHAESIGTESETQNQ